MQNCFITHIVIHYFYKILTIAYIIYLNITMGVPKKKYIIIFLILKIDDNLMVSPFVKVEEKR